MALVTPARALLVMLAGVSSVAGFVVGTACRHTCAGGSAPAACLLRQRAAIPPTRTRNAGRGCGCALQLGNAQESLATRPLDALQWHLAYGMGMHSGRSASEPQTPASEAQDSKVQDAIARCREAVARKPENEEAWFLLGVLLQETGELIEAEAAFEKSTALVPNSDPWISQSADRALPMP